MANDISIKQLLGGHTYTVVNQDASGTIWKGCVFVDASGANVIEHWALVRDWDPPDRSHTVTLQSQGTVHSDVCAFWDAVNDPEDPVYYLGPEPRYIECTCKDLDHPPGCA